MNAPTPQQYWQAVLCRLAGKVELLHPWIGPAWRDAVSEATKDLVSCADSEHAVSIYQNLLDCIGDSDTTIIFGTGVPFGREVLSNTKIESLQVLDDQGYLAATGLATEPFDPALPLRLAEALTEARQCRSLVLDLRRASWWFGRHFLDLAATITSSVIDLPVERSRFHSGHISDRPDSSAGSYVGFLFKEFRPIVPVSTANDLELILLADPHGGLALRVAAGMSLSGTARLLMVGPPFHPGGVIKVPLWEGVTAQIRCSDWVDRNGSSSLCVDAWVDAAGIPIPPTEIIAFCRQELATVGSLGLVNERSVVDQLPKQNSADVRPRSEHRTSSQSSVASLDEEKLSALFRLWSAVDAFCPSDRARTPWLEALPDTIALVDAARNAREYAQAVVYLLRTLGDHHARVHGRPVDHDVGHLHVCVEVECLDSKPVVTRVEPNSAFLPGDIVISVDGIPASERLALLGQWILGSTDHGLAADIYGLLLSGRAPETHVTIERFGIEETVVALRRQDPARPAALDPISYVGGRFWYLDLSRLLASHSLGVDGALVSGQPLLIDLRGYPTGTGWSVAHRLVKRSAIVARFERVEVRGAGPATSSRLTVAQQVEPELPISRIGPVFGLIGPTTKSRGEFLALLLRYSADAVLVGRPTNGTIGDVTTVKLPMGLAATFASQLTLGPSGEAIQGVGLTPDVHVERTLDSVMAGADEPMSIAEDLLLG